MIDKIKINQLNRCLTSICIIMVTACATQKPLTISNKLQGDTRTIPVESIDQFTYLLIESAEDKTYAYKKSNPVKVGGSNESSGPANERRYLNALLGPNGEEVFYYRAGSCCSFKTPNGLLDNTGMLDQYRVSWTGSMDTLTIYINMYDKGNLKIPVGLTAKQKN